MLEGQNRIAEIAAQMKQAQKPEPATVRTLLGWFDAQRRGYHVTSLIEKALTESGIKTQPDFRYAYIDAPVNFVLIHDDGADAETSNGMSEQNGSHVPNASGGTLVEVSVPDVTTDNIAPTITTISGAIEDPTYRIGRLPAANNPPVSVKPNGTLREAITLMLCNDFSQIPVMQSDRHVRGVVSWESIGARLAMGNTTDSLRYYEETPRYLSADDSIFAAVGIIVEHGYVLIRDAERKYTGIVTTSDLSLQFRQLGEPFLLIGEIENHIRSMVAGRFTPEELKQICNPSDTERGVTNVADLTFGEYLRLLQNAP